MMSNSGEVPTPDYRQLFGEEAWDAASEDGRIMAYMPDGNYLTTPEETGRAFSKALDSLLASGVLHIESGIRTPGQNVDWVVVYRFDDDEPYDLLDNESKVQRLVSEWQPA